MVWINMVRIRHNCVWVSEKYKCWIFLKHRYWKDSSFHEVCYLWLFLSITTITSSSTLVEEFIQITSRFWKRLKPTYPVYLLTSVHGNLHIQAISGMSLPLSRYSFPHKQVILQAEPRGVLIRDVEIPFNTHFHVDFALFILTSVVTEEQFSKLYCFRYYYLEWSGILLTLWVCGFFLTCPLQSIQCLPRVQCWERFTALFIDN